MRIDVVVIFLLLGSTNDKGPLGIVEQLRLLLLLWLFISSKVVNCLLNDGTRRINVLQWAKLVKDFSNIVTRLLFLYEYITISNWSCSLLRGMERVLHSQSCNLIGQSLSFILIVSVRMQYRFDYKVVMLS